MAMTGEAFSVRPTEAAFLEAAASIGAKLCRDGMWAGKRANSVAVAKYFAVQGLDVARPYLNPGSVDQYPIPEAAEWR